MRKWMVLTALVTTLGLAACDQGPPSAQDKNEQARNKLMERATNAVPVPEVDNFLTRKYIAKWMERMDDPSKVFFTYLYSNTGQEVLYAIGTRPINLCTLMTPPQKWWTEGGAHHSEQLGPAPTLSGVYGSGGGGCYTYYYFEAQTDRMIHFGGGWKYITADQPMKAPQAEPLGISVEKWQSLKASE